MSNTPSEAPQESWEDRANRVAASVIGTADSHDAFFDTMQLNGVSFILEKAGFNNFIAQLSNGSGYKIPTILGWAGIVNASEQVSNFETLTVEETHERIERVLGDASLVATIKKMGAGDKVFTLAQRELDMRKDIQKDANIGAIFPPYCQIGNPELKSKYAARDMQAKEFIFQCAKKAMLEKGAKFTELWQ